MLNEHNELFHHRYPNLLKVHFSKFVMIFLQKQKAAYEIYQCDWSSDVCSSDLLGREGVQLALPGAVGGFDEAAVRAFDRSEERRVGEECRSRRSPRH